MAKKKSRKKTTQPIFENEVSLYIYSLLVIALSVIGLLEVGVVGEVLTKAIKYLVGNMYGIFYLLLMIVVVILMKDKSLKQIKHRYIAGGCLLFLAWLILCATPVDESYYGMQVIHHFIDHSAQILDGRISSGGGIIGAFFYGISSLLFDRVGTFIVIAFLFICSFMLIVSKETRAKIKVKTSSFFMKRNAIKEEKKKQREEKKHHEELMKKLEFIDYNEYEQASLFEEEKSLSSKKFIDVNDVYGDELEVVSSQSETVYQDAIETNEVNKTETSDTPKNSRYLNDFSNYRLPSIRLLSPIVKKGKSGVNNINAQDKGRILIDILKQFGVNAALVDTHIGPSVTKFELRPENGVRISKISNLQQDIKMGLAAKDIRIEAPIPGKNTVGIEIPNVEKTMVSMRDLMRSIPSEDADKKLLFALGKDLMGNCVYGELNKMPHLLIAGATGSGKSVCVNSIITSILMRTKPDEVKMLLIDPKKVEFTPFTNIPHLLAPVITSGEEANRALKVIVQMMDERYDLFSKLGVRNINGYNDYLKQHPEETIKKMPYIMVVIDELADLMLVAAKEVEASIQRITQLARAAGIHLIVATQRPSVDVVTGVIKANIPSRIAFAVSSAVDSRTILDQQGAEKLLGYGDMLYVPVGEQVATRVQGCFVSDEEVHMIAEACSKQALPKYEDAFLRLEEVDSQGKSVSDFADPLYPEVRNFVISSQKASTSFIQRKFSIGYSRAARLVDQLEAERVIGPANGSKPREVYIKNEIET